MNENEHNLWMELDRLKRWLAEAEAEVRHVRLRITSVESRIAMAQDPRCEDETEPSDGGE
jgi:hypothetical protein